MKKLLQRRRPRSLLFYFLLVGGFAWWIHDYLIIEYAYAWFFSINMVTFAAFARDKMASKSAGFGRTPELTFHLLGLLGAFPAILAGQKVLNHKTSKTSFIIPMWILFFSQLLAAAWFFGNLNEVYARWQERGEEPQQQERPQLPPQTDAAPSGEVQNTEPEQ